MEIIAQAATDIGRKKHSNEDIFLIDPGLRLYLVADGMGGHAAGEVASAKAAEVSQRVIQEGLGGLGGWDDESTRQDLLLLIERAIRIAGREIHELATSDISKRGMGTTLSLLLLTPSRGYIAQRG